MTMENEQKAEKNSPIVLIIVVFVVIGIVGYAIYNNFVAKDDKNINTTTITTTVESPTEEKLENTTISNKENETTKQEKISLKGVSDYEVKTYDVYEEEGNGYYGCIIEIKTDDTIDGYEIKYSYDYYEGEELKTETEFLNKYSDKLYFSTQEGPSKIEIRTYYGNPNSNDAIYSDWSTIYDWKIGSYSMVGDIQTDEWETMIEGMTELHIY